MTKIIFLDIDGVMISDRKLLLHRYASFDQIFDDDCVDVLRLICETSGAKIVFNTTHNLPSMYKTLRERFTEHNFDDHIYHDDPKTDFRSTQMNRLTRKEAIIGWLKRNPDIRSDNWICFDDEPIDLKRAFRTNPEFGIGLEAHTFAEQMLRISRNRYAEWMDINKRNNSEHAHNHRF